MLLLTSVLFDAFGCIESLKRSVGHEATISHGMVILRIILGRSTGAVASIEALC